MAGRVNWREFVLRTVGLRRNPAGPVPHRGAPRFHCAACRQDLDDDQKTCPACGEPTAGTH